MYTDPHQQLNEYEIAECCSYVQRSASVRAAVRSVDVLRLAVAEHEYSVVNILTRNGVDQLLRQTGIYNDTAFNNTDILNKQ